MRAFSLLVIVAVGSSKLLNDHSGAELLVEIQSAADFADLHDVSFVQRKAQERRQSKSRRKGKVTALEALAKESTRELEKFEKKVADDIRKSQKVKEDAENELRDLQAAEAVEVEAKKKKAAAEEEERAEAKFRADVELIIKSRIALIEIQINMADAMIKVVDVEFPGYKLKANDQLLNGKKLFEPSKKNGDALDKEIGSKESTLKTAMDAWKAFRRTELLPAQDRFANVQMPNFEKAIVQVRDALRKLDKEVGLDLVEEPLGVITSETIIWDTLSRSRTSPQRQGTSLRRRVCGWCPTWASSPWQEQITTRFAKKYQTSVREMDRKSKNAIEVFDLARNALVVLQKKEAVKWKAARKAALELKKAEVAKSLKHDIVNVAKETEAQVAFDELERFIQETKKYRQASTASDDVEPEIAGN